MDPQVIERVCKWLLGYEQGMIRHAQTNFGSRVEVAIQILRGIMPHIMKNFPNTFVAYTTSRQSSDDLDAVASLVLEYNGMATKFEESWDVDSQRARPMSPESQTERDMIIIVDHDEDWSMDYVVMVTLLIRRIQSMVGESRLPTSSPETSRPGVLPFIRVLFVSIRPEMDARIHKIASVCQADTLVSEWRKQRENFKIMRPRSDGTTESQISRVKGEDVYEHLMALIGQSQQKFHAVLCFRPWDRLQSLQLVDRSQTDVAGNTTHIGVESWPEKRLHSRGDEPRVASERRDGISQFLSPTPSLPTDPKEIEMMRRQGHYDTLAEASKANKIVKVAFLEGASAMCEMVYEELAVWVIAGEEIWSTSLDSDTGIVIGGERLRCSAEEHAAQASLVRGDGRLILRHAWDTKETGPCHLGIDNVRVCDMICALGHLAIRDRGLDALGVAFALCSQPHVVSEMTRRLTCQGILGNGVSGSSLVSKVRPGPASCYDYRLSWLLQRPKEKRVAATDRVVALEALFAAVIACGSQSIVPMTQIRIAMSTMDVATMEKDKDFTLELEGSVWFILSIWHKVNRLGLSDDEKADEMMRSESIQGYWSALLARGRHNVPEVRVEVQSSSMERAFDAMDIAREAGITLTELDLEKVWSGGDFTSDERRVLYEDLLESFLFDLVVSHVQNGHIVTRLVLSNAIVSPTTLVGILIHHAAEITSSNIIFGICPTLFRYQETGEATMREWVWIPTDVIIKWHQSSHPATHLLQSVISMLPS